MLEFRPIKGYEGLYEITNDGRIWSLRRQIFLKTRYDKDGYIRISLHKEGKQKTYQVHRLVAQAFIDNPDNLPVVNHKDEDKTNNHVDNLEFCTVRYNNEYGTRKARISKKNGTKVRCIETGIVYDSMGLAAKAIDCSVTLISHLCNSNNRQLTAKGLHFEFV